MNNKLHIQNSQIVFSYRRNIDIRKRLFEFEDKLRGEFKVPFKTIAVPDEIDPNIPRFESQSVHSHSRLHISQTRITLATSFNKAFMQDYTQVRNYLNAKCSLLSGLAKSERMDFIAYVIELGVYMQENTINSFMKEHTGATAIDNDCRDFSILYSKEYKNDFYLNIKSSKFSEQELLLQKGTKVLRPSGKIKHGISTVLDINTKPFFNKNNKFDKSLYETIENEIFELMNSKGIKDFLQGNI